jgi:hypothetical protein
MRDIGQSTTTATEQLQQRLYDSGPTIGNQAGYVTTVSQCQGLDLAGASSSSAASTRTIPDCTHAFVPRTCTDACSEGTQWPVITLC